MLCYLVKYNLSWLQHCKNCKQKEYSDTNADFIFTNCVVKAYWTSSWINSGMYGLITGTSDQTIPQFILTGVVIILLLYTHWCILDIYCVVLSLILWTRSPNLGSELHGKWSDCLHKKCLAIATGQEPWQRYTAGIKATPSSSGSFNSL